MCYCGFVRQPKAVKEYFEKIARMGGKARAQKLTKDERKQSAQKAAQARWAKKKA